MKKGSIKDTSNVWCHEYVDLRVWDFQMCLLVSVNELTTSFRVWWNYSLMYKVHITNANLNPCTMSLFFFYIKFQPYA